MGIPVRCAAGPRVASLVLALIILLGAPASSAAQPGGSALNQARTAFSVRRYEQVVKLLRPMLYPRSRFATEAEEVEAYKLLGISHYWLGLLVKKSAEKKAHRKQAQRLFNPGHPCPVPSLQRRPQRL